ncbi:MAG: hypothetical protein WC637_00430 [Victivallales bacterium]|jgi:hypothetical protein
MDIQISKDLEFVIAALPSFGTRYAHLVMGYAQLFGVTPMHLKAKKFRIIIEEIKKLFDSQSFAWEKKAYSISHAGIGEALDIMIKRDFRKHLTNHNYLKTVMIDISERERKETSRTEEKNLHKKEADLMIGNGRPVAPSLNPSRQGREVNNDSSPLMGEDEGGGENISETRSINDLPSDIRQGIAKLKDKLGLDINNIGKRID